METQVEVDKVRNNDLFVRMDGGGNFGPHSQVCPIRSVGYLSLPPVLFIRGKGLHYCLQLRSKMKLGDLIEYHFCQKELSWLLKNDIVFTIGLHYSNLFRW